MSTEGSFFQGRHRPRGVIVVDSGVLMELQAAIRPVFLDDQADPDKPRHYLDMLSFLGRQGWHIVIPETVAYETASVVLGAPAIDDLYSVGSRRRIRGEKSELRDYSG